MAKNVRGVRAIKNPAKASSLAARAFAGHHAHSQVENERANCKAKTAFWRVRAHWHFEPVGKVEDDR